MKLYEIDKAIEECLDLETGEILDIDRLNEMQMERTKKLENVALYIKQLEAEADAIKSEEYMLAERRKAKQNKADRLKGWLAEVLSGQAFETARVKLSFRKSEKVEFTDEFELYSFISSKAATDKTYDNVIKYSYNISKTEVGKLLKAGEKIPGAVLVENQNLQMK